MKKWQQLILSDFMFKAILFSLINKQDQQQKRSIWFRLFNKEQGVWV